MTFRVAMAFVFWGAAAGLAVAQDQTFTVSDPPCSVLENAAFLKPIAAGQPIIDLKTGEVKGGHLRTLVERIDGLRLTSPDKKGEREWADVTQCDRVNDAPDPVELRADEAFLLHVVKWTADLKGAERQHWYVYQPSIPGRSRMSADDIAKDPRIYGRRKLRLIYFHLYDLRNPLDTAPEEAPSTSYNIKLTKKTPQPLTDFIGMASVALGARGLAIEDQPRRVGFLLEKQIDIDVEPSTIVIEAKAGAVSLGSKTFVNERKYHVDFSFAFPINSYKDVDLKAIETGVQPVKMDRQNIYAVVNVFFVPVDLTRPQQTLLPYLLLGVPIKSQPWRHTMVGVGVSFKWVSPFWGLVADIQPTTSGTQQTGNRTIFKGIFGVNVPVGTAKKILGG